MPPTTTAALLALLTREPGRPRITWYGAGGERVELSGAVLENWVNKTANLLVEEFDAGPGTRLLLDLPGHWRTLVWALATWRVGACVEVGGGTDRVDVVVTDRPAPPMRAADVVAVSLPALARRFDGSLPPGVLDAASAVMTYGDALGYVPPVDPGALALVGDGLRLTHAELLADADPEPHRTALLASSERDVADLLAVVRVLAGGGSVVLVAHDATARLDALVGQENVTRDLTGQR